MIREEQYDGEEEAFKQSDLFIWRIRNLYMIYLKKELIKVNMKALYKFLLTTGFKEKDVAKILTDEEAIL